jgi:hypothetical protein
VGKWDFKFQDVEGGYDREVLIERVTVEQILEGGRENSQGDIWGKVFLEEGTVSVKYLR